MYSINPTMTAVTADENNPPELLEVIVGISMISSFYHAYSTCRTYVSNSIIILYASESDDADRPEGIEARRNRP